jgi:hypothetical protein
MTKYIMRFGNSSISLAWEYPFEMPSTTMALDYACRHAILLKQDLVVFVEDGDAWAFLAEVLVTTTTTAKVVT